MSFEHKHLDFNNIENKMKIAENFPGPPEEYWNFAPMCQQNPTSLHPLPYYGISSDDFNKSFLYKCWLPEDYLNFMPMCQQIQPVCAKPKGLVREKLQP